MSIATDIDYSVLSLDSYNRGYNPGITGLGGIGATVGQRTLVMESNTDPASPEVAATFYAAVYEAGDGSIVISFRGTDDPWADARTGWPTGAGLIGSQAELAAEFYYKVKQAYPNAEITLTGHSLGGGLAGFVSKLTGSAACIFDNMPFELQADEGDNAVLHRLPPRL